MEEEKKNIQSLTKTSNSIISSFAKMKFISIACIIGIFATAAFCVTYTLITVNDLGKKIYVLDKGQVLTASREDSSVNRRDEVIAQSERFHTLFFTASPNRDVVQNNIESALRLCADRSAYTYYNAVQESGFYRLVSQSNAVQEIVVDSVKVDMRSYPYQTMTYSSLYVTRATMVVKSLLVTRMNFVEVPRDMTNLNGLKIENFEVVRKEEIERRNRVN